MSKGTRYDDRFRATVAAYAHKHGVGKARAKYDGLAAVTIRRWLAAARTIGDATLTPFTDGPAEWNDAFRKTNTRPVTDDDFPDVAGSGALVSALENRVKELLAENERLKNELEKANECANAMFEFIKHMMQRLEVKE